MKTVGASVALILVASLIAPIGYSQAEATNLTTPNPPANLNVAAVSSSQINLTWTPPVNSTTDQVNGYRIEARAGCLGIFNILVANTTTTATTYSNTGLASGTCYEYRVSAINPATIGNPSNVSLATTWSLSSAPISMTANTLSSSQINLNWVAPSNTGGTPINGYKIERRNSCSDSFITIVANTSNTNTSYANNGLVNGTCYQYRVFAHNAVGTSLSSNNVTATTMQIVTPSTIHVPSAPTGLTVTTASNTSLKLMWNTPSNSGGAPVIGYKIQRNDTTIVNNTGTTQTSYISTGLLVGHQQTYRVAAWNSAGLSPFSNNATGKPSNQTTSTIDNLGQLISDFIKQRNELFKQQRDETINALKECNTKIKNASLENRTKVKVECKATLKAINEKYKDARNQFKVAFKDFRDTAKFEIKEAKKENLIGKEDIKDFKKDLKEFKNETKQNEKEIKKEINEIKKETKQEEKQLKKELKKEKKKNKKEKHDGEDND